jgi:hypothetical protein
LQILLKQITEELFSNKNKNNNVFEKSFSLYKLNNFLSKHKIANKTLSLNDINKVYELTISFIKNIDEYLWRIAQKSIISLFDINYKQNDQRQIDYFFNLLKETIIKHIDSN